MVNDKNQFGYSDFTDLSDLMPRQNASEQQSFDTKSHDSFHEATSAQLIEKVDPLIGQILDNRYLIERNLSEDDGSGKTSADRGGVGIVYLAKDLKNISRPVVVKAIKNEILQHNSDVLRKFQHEREALLRFDHPNIVGLLDSGTLPDGNPYLVMPFIQGHSLRRVLKKVEETGEKLSFNFCANVIEAVTDALAAAHAEQILHRDIKPENVMLTPQANGKERVRLIDFGVARVTDSKVAPITQHNRISGTILYMAPEQLRGELNQTPAVDVYSCGVMFYELLTGKRPFEPKTIFEMVELQKAGLKTPPSALRVDVPLAVDKILLPALEYEPKKRPLDIAEFGKELAKELRVKTDYFVPQSNKVKNNQLAETRLTNDLNIQHSSSSQNQHQSDNQNNFSELKTLPSDIPILPSAVNREPKPHSGKYLLAIVGAIAIIILFGLSGFLAWVYVRPEKKDVIAADSSTKPIASSVAGESDKRHLSYFLEVQKMRSGMPYEEPYRATGQEIYESGYKFKIALVSDTKGFLYLFNEGKDEKGETVYNILFPTPIRNQGSAEIEKNVTAETAFNTFGGGRGTETVWVIWSMQPNNDLEAARQNAFNNRGVVADVSARQKLIDFIQTYGEKQPEVIKDTANIRSTIKTAEETFAYKLQLEHR